MTRIKNDLQLAATKKWLDEFEQALELANRNTNNLSPRLYKAHVDGIRSQIDDLQVEIKEYEALKANGPNAVAVESLEDLPEALIRARIAQHLTQEELADRIGVRPQQVQKWEASVYQSAKYASVLKLARELGIHMQGGVQLAIGISTGRSAETPEAKARWFQSLSLEERMELLCNYADLILENRPSAKEDPNVESAEGRVLVIRKP
jgi:transcriptional regulator with XRE-family HTH domain